MNNIPLLLGERIELVWSFGVTEQEHVFSFVTSLWPTLVGAP